jgi:hypothetical protein
MFWDHAKTLEKDTVTKLLKSVFEVPSPKGVLFEKAAHVLITNDMVRSFQWYSYNERDNEKDEVINFPKCKLEHFEIKELQGAFQEALAVLEAGDLEGDASAIALEPKDTSFDAVDMFVLVKEGQDGVAGDWRLYLLQDTISKDHSLHPVKVLWYCALFCDAYRFVFESTMTMTSTCCNAASTFLLSHKRNVILPSRSPSPTQTGMRWSEWQRSWVMNFPRSIRETKHT